VTKSPYPLSLKPDLADAARRWEAYYQGEIIDRPVVYVTAPRTPGQPGRMPWYHELVFDPIDAVIDRGLASAGATYWGGEAVPYMMISFGPDEIAAFSGAEFRWSPDSPDTNWSTPLVQDWERDLPVFLHHDNRLWQRMLALYRRAAQKLDGKMLLSPPDLHSNMDLLSALRGPERLCMDLIETPELIDRAMADSRRAFRELWPAIVAAGQMDEHGYSNYFYSMEGCAVLQCDFSCMISPPMFRRWVLPALEEEAALVSHVLYHWDGPNALIHEKDLVASKGLHTFSYVTGAGHGDLIEYLDLLKRVQAAGKAVQVYGTVEQLKTMHKELRPEKAYYVAQVASPSEADALLEWFVKNT
jgi:hypothetical protein